MNRQAYIRNAATNYYPALVEPAHSSRREQVRWRVRHLNLCALGRQTRQDAASDPGIEWCPVDARPVFIDQRPSQTYMCPGKQER